ncbi:hypothetical protein [Synechococcus sp. M16CYN]|uniref:hypothetical protein n=1 Tax=Synechococcus sp. M16CYN TaxID=3103139 RepID=UPI00334167E7
MPHWTGHRSGAPVSVEPKASVPVRCICHRQLICPAISELNSGVVGSLNWELVLPPS